MSRPVLNGGLFFAFLRAIRKYDWNFQPGRDILKHVCAILNDWGIESIVFAVIHPAGPDPGPGGVPAHLQFRPSGHCGALPGARRGVPATPDFFDVLLHLGTLVAVFAAYWQDIRDMIVELIDGVRDLVRGTTPNPIPAGTADDPADYRGHAAPVCGAAGEGSGGGPVRQYLFRGGGL